ncbi:AIM24 family protein [Rhodococcus opacus]|uniref:AIM24 family protein n=1 Tax=Rhodococcus opacus TaxID=37919 RepID=UPI000AB0C87A|nr:AIM24 family protein [Rhodococcus opacus]
MRSDLMKNAERSGEPGTFVLQNPRMLKVDLAGTSGHFFARQGSMVAYQGDVDFAYQGSGGVGKFFKKALTGEGMSLMKVSGSGDVFLARDADEIFLLELEDESVTVSGSNVLAFDSSLSWDINRVEGASMLSGGLFNTTFTGRGVLAVTIYGTPRRPERGHPHLRRHAERGAVVDRPEFDDPQDREDGRRDRPRFR